MRITLEEVSSNKLEDYEIEYLERLIKGWGHWKLKLSSGVLEFKRNIKGEYDWYEVDLERCETPSAIMDWIFHITNKGTDYEVMNLIIALADLDAQDLCFSEIFNIYDNLTNNIVPVLKAYKELKKREPVIVNKSPFDISLSNGKKKILSAADVVRVGTKGVN